MANGRICFGKVAATRFGKVLSGWQNGHSRCGIPEYYLGADIIQAEVEWALEPIDWIISSKTYTRNVIPKFEQLMGDRNPKYSFGEYKTPMDKDTR